MFNLSFGTIKYYFAFQIVMKFYKYAYASGSQKISCPRDCVNIDIIEQYKEKEEREREKKKEKKLRIL